MRAIRVHQYGGPEAMRLEELPTPAPGPGQVLVRIEAAGVNFIDVYQRTGLYKGALPVPLGLEAAGVVEAVAPGVTEVKAGDRMAWTGAPGSYATHNLVPADRLAPPRRRRRADGRGGHAPGDDRPLPRPLDVSPQAR
jgi:NADPH:quinone reductase